MGRVELRRSFRRLHGLNSDESGSISLASVFALVLLAYLLGLVMNSARQADQRVKLQNAADAAAHSG
ncbi:MAG: pilus assembly protein TadG-related protein, partial [Pirellulaceae bacterium]|nr:pilus assembly protein TadG-related protein [Pirellulaceae bacterium]